VSRRPAIPRAHRPLSHGAMAVPEATDPRLVERKMTTVDGVVLERRVVYSADSPHPRSVYVVSTGKWSKR
jgi:hypothetical protein